MAVAVSTGEFRGPSGDAPQKFYSHLDEVSLPQYAPIVLKAAFSKRLTSVRQLTEGAFIRGGVNYYMISQKSPGDHAAKFPN